VKPKHNVTNDATEQPAALANRTLADVEAELALTFKSNIENILRRGALLCEAKKLVSHGEWEYWLKDKSALPPRTAQKYMAAYRYVSEKDDLKSAPGTLLEPAPPQLTQIAISSIVVGHAGGIIFHEIL
jgi:hypothetical protein